MPDLNREKRHKGSPRETRALAGSQSGESPAFLSASENHSSTALIPALRVILSSVERTIGHPLGKNEQLAATLRRLDSLLGKLPRMTDSAFIDVIEALANEKRPPHAAKRGETDVQPLRDLSLDEVERLISDPAVTKQRLLAIVRERFGGSIGALSKLRHEALIARVAALAMNERSHETVARLASRDANQFPPGASNSAADTQAATIREQPKAG